MKSNKFLLGNVLKLYAAREEAARIALGHAIGQRQSVETALAGAVADGETAARAYGEDRERRHFTAGCHAPRWAALQQGEASCQALRTRLAAAFRNEEQARGALLQARRKHEMMTNLHSRHLENLRHETLRTEEHELADLFNAGRTRQLREMPESCAEFV